MTEVDYGGGGAPHTAKRSMINLCVFGVPLATYIKEQGEGAGGLIGCAPRGESYSYYE